MSLPNNKTRPAALREAPHNVTHATAPTQAELLAQIEKATDK
jgi:hypothetical protein